MDSIKQMIKKDIDLCNEAIEHPEKSNTLYGQLMAKYKLLFSDFGKGMMPHIKTLRSNYVTELQEIKSQLEVYLMLDLKSINDIQKQESENKKKESAKIKKGDVLKTAFDSYTIVKMIAQGGNGRVFEVFNEDGKSYAAKIVDMKNLIDDKRKRLKNEIYFCEMNSHENIIHIIDDGIFEKCGGSYIFYIMPLYQINLRGLMKRNIDPERIINCFEDICKGLEYAHKKECVHRDIKPENILINESGRCVIADFGIAHFIKNDQRTLVETKSNSRLANFSYRAPEQIDGSNCCTSATDIFALGLILNEMFTGNIPSGANFKKIGDVNAEYAFLDGLVDKMIAQAPEKRHQNSHELLIDYSARLESESNIRKIQKLKEPVSNNLVEFNSIEIVDIKIVDNDLVIVLSDTVNTDWQNLFRNALDLCIISPYCYSQFRFDENKAKYRLSEIYDDSIAVGLINEFKKAVKATNLLYIEKLKEYQQLLYETEIRIRQEEIERLSRENALSAKLKKLL